MIKIKNIAGWKALSIVFLLIWIGLNFLSAELTEIMSDEAYYSLYGENMAWAYYDHPPMVAVMNFISNLLFDGNLSVRFMTIALHLFTLLLTAKIIREKSPTPEKVTLFFVIMASMVLFQAFGFVTTPDIGLLFFTALFLYFYQQFTEKETWAVTLGLAFSMAGMVYSKYHAALIIGLIVLSNLRLLGNRKALVAVFIALLALVPHFYWQMQLDFPSFKYHLNGRSSEFQWLFFLEYLPNQLVVFNPFAIGALVYIFVKYRPGDVFERGLYFLIIGMIAFFWMMTFRGHIEPHWTVACTIPMAVLIYRYSLRNPKLMRFVKTWVAGSIVLVLIARALLTTDLLPEYLNFYGKEAKCKAIASVAGERPVVFTGSFQHPSDYHFFTKNEAFVLSAVNSRQTQFDIWQKELACQGKPVFIVGRRDGKSQVYTVDGFSFHGYFAEHFQSVNRVVINFEAPQKEFYAGDTLHIAVEMDNPTTGDIDFRHPEFPVTCKAVFAENRKKGSVEIVNAGFETPVAGLRAGEKAKAVVKVVVPDLTPDAYKFAICLDNVVCTPQNSDYVAVRIRE
ncbi:MAG: glycosyltransferase family 39 protein [Tannerella sp.]|jgi:4-amino-4-deoxy-L-arabinose transferase-like glycosyltransferase|nr:glycosyltransferase family 39 protein [Tannerella sp.]